jgi:alanine racemase
VVKADGYGHGAAPAARAALAGGARSLAVATAAEAAGLRAAGIDAPMLVMGALSDEELPVALGAGAEVVAWRDRFVSAVLGARERLALDEPVRVHVKLDTGMGRLGTRVFDEAVEVASRVAAAGPELELAGAMTHFASADEDPSFTSEQLSRFEPFVRSLRARWPGIVAHAANSAATLRFPESHLDLVRCGIAIYGCDPMNVEAAAHGLEPALELSSYVAAVKAAAPGESAGYGRRWVARAPTWLATVPLGYADGIRRALTNNCEVLIGGRRYPLVGTVSMDNITVEVGMPDAVRCGDQVTIIGVDGGERVTAEELAGRIGTINYEIVCGVSARVPRVYHRDGVPT